MSVIKAIDTEYAGHLFRSRLEARWAVFFDKLRIPWHYEEQGYELPSGRYLPDFRIERGALNGTADLWVEVKGVLEHEEFIRVIRSAAELPRNTTGPVSAQLLILGEVPVPGEGTTHTRIDLRPEGFALQRVHFRSFTSRGHHGWTTSPIGEPDVFPLSDLNLWTNDATEFLRECTTSQMVDPYLRCISQPDAAYRAARSARFEHGQSGAQI